MSSGSCHETGCTVADTGVCLLSHEPASSCPNFVPDDTTALEPESDNGAAAATTEATGRRFPSGMELGVEEVDELMRGRYAHLVGVLGRYGAGKTCFLLSLYLKASLGNLPGYRFAGSETLPGFEARARLLRQWRRGDLPKELADHTRVGQDRQAGLLHLALRPKSGSDTPIDLLLTDLPGEWSESLVARASTATRFRFLQRADGLIVVVDGPSLVSAARHVERQRSRHLLERLARDVGVDLTTPLVLLITKLDELKGECPDAAQEIKNDAERLGFAPELVLCSAFSRCPAVVCNGEGVVEALAPIVGGRARQPMAPPRDRDVGRGRVFLDLAGFGL